MTDTGNAEKRPERKKPDQKMIHEQALADFKRCCEAEEPNRVEALDDLRFARLGEQWPQEVRTQREQEGRPCLTFNRLPTFGRQVVNDSRMNRPAIKVHPVDSGADPQTAEIIDGLIRHIEVTSQADIAYDTAIDNAVFGGWGYIRVNIDYACDDTFDLDIRIERVANIFTVYGDPDSTEADSSDWNLAFVTEMLSRDEFKARYPDADANPIGDDGSARDANWFDGEQVRVAEYWVRRKVKAPIYLLDDGTVLSAEQFETLVDDMVAQGIIIEPAEVREVESYEVTQYIITGAEVLETNKWPGRYIPLIVVYGDEVMVEGKRYWRSLIRDAKDAQRSYNYWRTSAIEKVALDTKAPYIGPKGSFNHDQRKWNTANTKNHPFIEYDVVANAGPPARQFGGGVPAGDLAMTAQASDDLKNIMGLHDASLGARSNETSGIAIRQRQKEGDTATFHFIDNLARAIRHTGRVVVNLVPKVYTTARVVRVLGEDRKPKAIVPGQPAGMVPVNQPLMIDGMQRVYDLTAGKYDVTVSTGPSFSTQREEAAAFMVDLVKAQPAVMPLIADLLVSNQDFYGSDEIAQRLKNMVPPQAFGQQPQQGPNPQQVQQMMQGMQQMQAQLAQLSQANQQLEAQLKDKQTENAIKLREADTKAYAAETERMQVLMPPPTPPAPVGATAAPSAGQEPAF